VLIEASPAILAARLAARAREDAAEIEARLKRAAALETAIPDAVRIDNSGALEAAIAAFVAALKRIQAGSAA
jgi:ribose 1,5-bisphosphokinase PhnN